MRQLLLGLSVSFAFIVGCLVGAAGPSTSIGPANAELPGRMPGAKAFEYKLQVHLRPCRVGSSRIRRECPGAERLGARGSRGHGTIELVLQAALALSTRAMHRDATTSSWRASSATRVSV